MNDEEARQGLSDNFANRSPQSSQRDASTRLQAYVRVTFDVLADAGDELDDDRYRAYLLTLEERLGLEAARLVAGEAIRARGGASALERCALPRRPRLVLEIPLEGHASLRIHARSHEDELRLRDWLRRALFRRTSLSGEITRWLDELDVRETA
jgi:hypothetical protein